MKIKYNIFKNKIILKKDGINGPFRTQSSLSRAERFGL
jgi:hypothetical protein